MSFIPLSGYSMHLNKFNKTTLPTTKEMFLNGKTAFT